MGLPSPVKCVMPYSKILCNFTQPFLKSCKTWCCWKVKKILERKIRKRKIENLKWNMQNVKCKLRRSDACRTWKEQSPCSLDSASGRRERNLPPVPWASSLYRWNMGRFLKITKMDISQWILRVRSSDWNMTELRCIASFWMQEFDVNIVLSTDIIAVEKKPFWLSTKKAVFPELLTDMFS